MDITDQEYRELVLQKGDRARSLLEDEFFNETVVGLKKAYFENWIDSDSGDDREKIHAKTLALGDLLDVLVGFVTEAAQIRMNEENDNAESE